MAPFLISYRFRAPGLPLHASKVWLCVSTLLDNCLAQVHSKVLVPQGPPCISVALLSASFAVTQVFSSEMIKTNQGAVLETINFRDHTQTAACVSLDEVWVSLLCYSNISPGGFIYSNSITCTRSCNICPQPRNLKTQLS